VNYHFNANDTDSTAPAVAIMPTKMPVKAPPPVQTAYNWTGAYVGGEAAYRLADATWNTTDLPSVDPFTAAPCDFGAGIITTACASPDPTTNPAKFFSAAGQGGVFLGYDWQIARRWVAGVEGDIDFGRSSMTVGGIPGAYGNGSLAAAFLVPGIEAQQNDSATVTVGWDSSVRARVGWLSSPTVLVYGTGGVAFQQLSVAAACNATIASWCGIVFNDGVARSETASTVRTGYTIGGGLEGILTGNWFGKLDFRYADFGHFNHNFFAGTLDEVDTSTHLTTYMFLAGVGYKFNGTGTLMVQ